MPKRIMQGLVVSDKQDKTIVVKVERRVMHPVYKKFITKSKKYAAHDADNRFKVGDTVRIEECRPISKNKCWVVLADDPAQGQPGQGPGGCSASRCWVVLSAASLRSATSLSCRSRKRSPVAA